jgi:DNA-directed RNA polymerase subunit RPC12/RpoP
MREYSDIQVQYMVEKIISNPLMMVGNFRKVREEYAMTVQNTCFRCGRKFKDDDNIWIVSSHEKGNRFICEECANEIKKEIERENSK